MAGIRNYNFLRYVRGSGLEIGALDNPLPINSRRANVSYVDVADKDGLVSHNPQIGDRHIKSPDIIADARDLGAIPSGKADFIIANHLLEHLPDPVRALNEFYRVLKAGGILYLAVPDKRYTFDKEREITSLKHLRDDYDNSADFTACREHYEEWFRLVESKKDRPVAASPLELMDKQYRIHFHVWQPEGVLELLRWLGKEFKAYFKLQDYYYRKGDVEAVFILRKEPGCLMGLPPVLKERYPGFPLILNRSLCALGLFVDCLKNAVKQIAGRFIMIGDYSFTALIAREIDNDNPILDIGCGRASLFRHIVKDNYKVGVDIYYPYIERSRVSPVHNRYVLADFRALPFKSNSFGFSVASEVLEHLSKDDGVRMLGEMERVSRNKIILTTPNGFLPVYPGGKDNPEERHLCGCGCSGLRGLGYKVYGINSLKILWTLRRGQAVMRFGMGKTILGRIAADMIRIFVYCFPVTAFQLLAVKEKPRPG